MPRRAAFWWVGGILALFMAGASAPSPLYVVYRAEFGFSAFILSLVFGVYAVALLASLLTVGSVSDHLGRRPVLVGAVLAGAGAMSLFAVASSVGWLPAARVVQGLATGAVPGTLGGVLATSTWLFVVGTVIAGAGFGAAFPDVFRALGGVAITHHPTFPLIPQKTYHGVHSVIHTSLSRRRGDHCMIVVTTPTGRIGHQLLTNLIDPERPEREAVRVVARDASRIPSALRERVEVVEGSSDDPEVIGRALDGADALFWLVPPDMTQDDATRYYLRFTQPASEAVTHLGVRHVVAVSSLGRDHEGDAGLLSAAFAMEELLENSGAHYRGLAMPYFMDNVLGQVRAITSQGAVPMANRPDRPLAMVATSDIASVAAEVLNRPLRLQETSVQDLTGRLMQFGASAGFAEGMGAMIRAQDAGIYDAEHAASPRTATSFRQWCEQVLAPAVAA